MFFGFYEIEYSEGLAKVCQHHGAAINNKDDLERVEEKQAFIYRIFFTQRIMNPPQKALYCFYKNG